MDNRGQCNTDSVKQEANLSALGQLADGKPDVLAASALACMQHAQPCCKACYWNEGNLSPAAALSRATWPEKTGGRGRVPRQSQLPSDMVTGSHTEGQGELGKQEKTSVKHLDNAT